MVKKYEIGGKTYIQKPLVLGQIRQVREVLAGMVMPSTLTMPDIMASLEDCLPLALAVVLTPEGTSPKGKNLQGLADELEYSIEAETAVEVIEDFFICNPVVSLVQKLTGMVDKIREAITKKTGSKSSVSSSPTETSPEATPSCGNSLSENVPLI